MADEPAAPADAAIAAINQTGEDDEETAALYIHARSAVPGVVIIDRINKQSNIGGIVRSASAFGVNHLCFVGPVRAGSRRTHVDGHSTKPANVPYQHMTAAQLNLCFHDKAISFSRFPEFASCRAALSSLGYLVLAVEISDASTPSHQFRYPARSAFLPGNEALGVSVDVLAQCDALVHVEQWGGQQSSLNVAVATAVLMSDYMRQNGGQPGLRRGSKFVQHGTSDESIHVQANGSVRQNAQESREQKGPHTE